MKLNLDDNGYVVGWTLDKSDKKLSSDDTKKDIGECKNIEPAVKSSMLEELKNV